MTYDEDRDVIAAAVPATLGGVVPILRVADLAVSIGYYGYYVDRLGFTLQWQAELVASVRRDGASVMLCEGDQGSPGTWLWLSTSDADALYEELRGRGAHLRHPPTNYPWGSRECQVSDPDGHVLRFGSDVRPGEPMGEWLDEQGRGWALDSAGGWRLSE